MQNTPPELVEAIRKLIVSKNDQEAWDVLHKYLRPILYATSCRILRGHQDLAKDATQDALVKLLHYARFADFQDKPEALRSYALVICKNESLGYLKVLLRDSTLPGEEKDMAEIVSTSDPNPESIAIYFDLLAKATLRLDQRQRELLDLLMQGYSIQDIADKLQISYRATAVRIHRLRNELFEVKALKTR